MLKFKNKSAYFKVKPLPKVKSFTIIIAPEKSGSSKVLKFPVWIISAVICFCTVFLTLFIIFTYRYNKLNSYYRSYKEMIKIQSVENKTNATKFDDYIKTSETLKQKIKVLQELENKMRDKLNSKGFDKNNLVASSLIDDSMEISAYSDLQIEKITCFLDDYNNEIARKDHIPSFLPIIGEITSPYGYRKSPTSRGYSGEFHTGLDIAGNYGDPVHAAASGYIEFAGWDGNYGRLVIINHGNGYVSYYGHNSKILVKKNQNITKGDTISLVGSSGRSTGCHVHFEIRLNGTVINPLNIIGGRN